jgi:hypothetical protein
MVFRYGFRELVRGRHPDDPDWFVHANNADRLSEVLGDAARWRGSLLEQRNLIELVAESPVADLAVSNRFADWLGHIGLVLWHTSDAERRSFTLTRSLIPQFFAMLPTSSSEAETLRGFLRHPERALSWEDLERSRLDS